ncbi:MAG: preprotein translocase subunit SecY [Lachnospiraceae bacterium]|nr:preprotein translocase subunit SecY [Lachnospiraceae bacterium]
MKAFIDAFKVKEIRTRMLFLLICLVIVRIGCQIPAPGFDRDLIAYWQSQMTESLGFLNMLTGGSFSQMSIFALNIGPYISAEIIMQLLTIIIPRLEELKNDGESGRKKIAEYSRYTTVLLAVIESVAMSIGFGRSNQVAGGLKFTTIVVMTISFTAGTCFLMWLGELMTEKGIGSGISMILLINIVSTLPSDAGRLYTDRIKGQSVLNATVAIIIAAVLIVAVLILIILLQDAQRKIPVQYAKRTQGRKTLGGQSSFIPLKVNTAGVMPVIFAMAILNLPAIICGFFGVQAGEASFGRKILKLLSSQYWFDFSNGWSSFVYTFGALLYIAMLFFFAYFYTAITFNPNEVANNLKKQGGFLPGVRPGTPTANYLKGVLNYVIVIGAFMLMVIALLPIICSGVFNARLSFGGTSLIIIAGVIVESMRQVEGMMKERHYKGFLNDSLN